MSQKYQCCDFPLDFYQRWDYNENKFGLVAQLGERSVRIREVEGSIPFESTKGTGPYPSDRGLFFSIIFPQFLK